MPGALTVAVALAGLAAPAPPLDFMWLGKTEERFALLQLGPEPRNLSGRPLAEVLTFYKTTQGAGDTAFDYVRDDYLLDCADAKARRLGRSEFRVDGGGVTYTTPKTHDRALGSDPWLKAAADAVCRGRIHAEPRLHGATPRVLIRAARNLGPG